MQGLGNRESENGEWYSQGLRFSCTQCGNCCTGPEGCVWFSPQEGTVIAKQLGVSEQTFLNAFARKVRGGWSLNERKTEHGFDCVFLDRETMPGKAICSLYEARPAQCRSWPFWPENLPTERAWQEAKGTTPCPGMDHGTLVRIEDIRIQRDSTPPDH